MELDENHRSANPCEVCFDANLFNEILKIKVTAEIFETEEGAEVESMSYQIYDSGLDEWLGMDDEVKSAMSELFFNDCSERALDEWGNQK